MYEFISGEIAKIDLISGYIVVENNGIGYKLFVTSRDSSKAKLNTKQNFYLHFRVKEDLQELYGFIEEEDRNIFETIIQISGVGPKIAVAILSTFTSDELYAVVDTSDINALTSISGIGKRTAEKMMLDLKAKLKIESIGGVSVTQNISQKVYDALGQLGYSSQEINSAIANVNKLNENIEAMDVEKRDKLYIKESLKYFNSSK